MAEKLFFLFRVPLCLKNDGRFEAHDLVDTDQGGKDDNDHNRCRRHVEKLPGQAEREFCSSEQISKERSPSNSKAIAQSADHQSLQENHAQENAIRRSHGLEGSEIA